MLTLVQLFNHTALSSCNVIIKNILLLNFVIKSLPVPLDTAIKWFMQYYHM